MKGTIRAKGRCVSCGSTYEKDTLLCSCRRRAERGIYIDLHDPRIPNGEHRAKIFADERGRPFTSQRHAQWALDHIRYELDTGTFDGTKYVARAARELLFENYSERWLKIREGQMTSGAKPLSRYTYRGNVSRVRSMLQPLPQLMGKDIRELRGSHIAEIALALRTSPSTGGELLASTQVTALSTLRHILHDAERWGDIERCPPFPRLSLPAPKLRIPTEEQRAAIFGEIDQQERPIFWLLRFEPIRPCEARRLEPGDVDLAAGIMTIRAEIRKAGPTYQLPIHPEVAKVLRAILEGPTPPGPGSKLFLHADGNTGQLRQYTDNDLNYIWGKACRDSGIEGHTLKRSTRHFLATAAVNRGQDIGVVSAALGHTTTQTAARYYVRYKPEALSSMIIPDGETGTADRHQTGTKRRKSAREGRKNRPS